MERFIAECGFTHVRNIGSSLVISYYKARRGENIFFIKATKDRSRIDALKREVVYADFMTDIIRIPEGIRLLKGHLYERGWAVFAAFPFVWGRWLGAQRVDQLLFQPNKTFEQRLVVLEHAHARASARQVEMAYGSADYNAVEHMQSKLTEEVRPHIGNAISEDEFDRIWDWVSRQRDVPVRFQHGDVMPSNICYDKAGRLILVDAQFSGFRMKWWDISYFFVQTYTFSRSPGFAKRVLRCFLGAFKNDGIESEILCPLRYRSTINLVEARGESAQLARILWDKVQTGNLSVILS